MHINITDVNVNFIQPGQFDSFWNKCLPSNTSERTEDRMSSAQCLLRHTREFFRRVLKVLEEICGFIYEKRKSLDSLFSADFVPA